MKVLQINSVCGIGSTGRIATDIYKALEEQGHQCLIGYGRGNAPKDIKTVRIGTNIDNYIHFLKTRVFDKHCFSSVEATVEFIEQIKEYNPDIIHLHNIHGYYINIEVLFNYFKDSGSTVIWSLYDCWSFTGHCSHFDYIGCYKWEKGCHKCPQKKEYPSSYLFDNSKENYNRKKNIILKCDKLTIVPPTMWLSNLVSKSYLKNFPTSTIPSGIDIKMFKPTENKIRTKYNLKNKYIVLGISNGFSEFKGSKYLIKLAERLPEEYKIVMIGVKEKEMKLLPENILALPRTNDIIELAQFYTVADVFVNPSLQETQGLTNIEALACGTPVVAFNSGGIPECMDPSCGYIVERGNTEEFIKAVMKTCEDPFRSEDCIQIAKKFDKSKLLNKYIQLYKDVLN